MALKNPPKMRGGTSGEEEERDRGGPTGALLLHTAKASSIPTDPPDSFSLYLLGSELLALAKYNS